MHATYSLLFESEHAEPATKLATETSTAVKMTVAAAELHAEETAAAAAAALKVEA